MAKMIGWCLCLVLALLPAHAGGQEQEVGALCVSTDCREMGSTVLRTVPVPRGYHEGLFYDGERMWVANGEGGAIWLIDLTAGTVAGEITPTGAFTEAITALGDGSYIVSEWDDRKLYRVGREGARLLPEAERSFSPAHPAGVVWTGSRLYAVTWLRGLGTKFHLVEMDREMRVLRSFRIRSIHEPCQLAWDGTHLWISSWYSRAIYKVDIERMEIVAQVASPVSLTTGIAWVGTSLWVTGTYSDLYELEIASS